MAVRDSARTTAHVADVQAGGRAAATSAPVPRAPSDLTPQDLPRPDPAPRARQMAPTLSAPRPPSRGRRFPLLWTAIAVAACGLALFGVRYEIPRQVDHYPILPATFVAELTAPATLDARRIANVATTGAGQIVSLPVEEGDVVAAGDVLGELDPRTNRAELAAAEASAASAARTVEMARAELARARSAQERLAREHQRQTSLAGRGVIASAALEASADALAQAQADRDRAEAAVAQALAEEKAATARTDVRRTLLDESTVRAPFAGIVTDVPVHVGDTLATGAPVATVVDPASLIFTAWLDEASVGAIRPGQRATVTLPGTPAETLGARVLQADRTVDSETREFTVDLVPDMAPSHWAIGQRARVTIGIAAREGALATPTRTLAPRGGEPGVWVVRDGRIHWRPITLGGVSGDRVEVLDGLSPGEIVVDADRPYEAMRVVPRSSEDGS